MNFEFRRPDLADIEECTRVARAGNPRSCEESMANLYLWKRDVPVEYCLHRDMLLVHQLYEEGGFRFPLGKDDHLKEVIEDLKAYEESQGRGLILDLVTPDQLEVLRRLFPDQEMDITWHREWADYIYDREKLSSLSGRKYHGKKNHVNRFMRLYPDWSYEPIDDHNVEDCFQMAMAWRTENIEEAGVEDESESRIEIAVTMNALRLMKELGLRGGALRVNGRIAAFAIGEPLGQDTFVVHIEKADTSYEGAYAMINQQFALHETEGFTYINREDDAGDPGLRQAKESYRPVFLLEKATVKFV